MNQIEIFPRDSRTQFQPGEEFSGEISWDIENLPAKIELRLFWFTRGKGTEDLEIVDTIPFDAPQSFERRPFRLTLPPGPYSFSGKLISLIWAIEVVALPSKEAARFEFTIGPDGREIRLGAC
jgi:hypothetical protein